MNKPKDILSPDAPFIQTGRDVVNRADSIVEIPDSSAVRRR